MVILFEVPSARIAALEQQIEKEKDATAQAKAATVSAAELAAQEAVKKVLFGQSNEVGAKFQGQVPSRPTYDLLQEAETKLEACASIALHLVGALQEPRLLQAFTKKGRFKDLIGRIPIHVITTRAALVGAATYGLESLKDLKE